MYVGPWQEYTALKAVQERHEAGLQSGVPKKNLDALKAQIEAILLEQGVVDPKVHEALAAIPGGNSAFLPLGAISGPVVGPPSGRKRRARERTGTGDDDYGDIDTESVASAAMATAEARSRLGQRSPMEHMTQRIARGKVADDQDLGGFDLGPQTHAVWQRESPQPGMLARTDGVGRSRRGKAAAAAPTMQRRILLTPAALQVQSDRGTGAWRMDKHWRKGGGGKRPPRHGGILGGTLGSTDALDALTGTRARTYRKLESRGGNKNSFGGSDGGGGGDSTAGGSYSPMSDKKGGKAKARAHGMGSTYHGGGGYQLPSVRTSISAPDAIGAADVGSSPANYNGARTARILRAERRQRPVQNALNVLKQDLRGLWGWSNDAGPGGLSAQKLPSPAKAKKSRRKKRSSVEEVAMRRRAYFLDPERPKEADAPIFGDVESLPPDLSPKSKQLSPLPSNGRRALKGGGSNIISPTKAARKPTASADSDVAIPSVKPMPLDDASMALVAKYFDAFPEEEQKAAVAVPEGGGGAAAGPNHRQWHISVDSTDELDKQISASSPMKMKKVHDGSLRQDLAPRPNHVYETSGVGDPAPQPQGAAEMDQDILNMLQRDLSQPGSAGRPPGSRAGAPTTPRPLSPGAQSESGQGLDALIKWSQSLEMEVG